VALLALLLFASDPVLESVERLSGDVRRPTLWAPLAVTLSSRAGFEGDLIVESEFRFSTVRRVKVPAGGRLRVSLPALAPRTIRAGPATLEVPPPGRRADLVVGVDERLPFAGDLASDPRRQVVRVRTDDLRTLPAGSWEGLDLLLLAEDAGLPLGGETWVVAPTRDAADSALGALQARPPRIEAREDGELWSMVPAETWVPAKRTRTALFAAVYGFAGFAALAVLSRRGGRAVLAGIGGLAVVGTLAAALLPKGQLWVLGHECEVHARAAPPALWRVWHVGAAVPLETRVSFPSLVRPVFRSFEGAPQPFSLRIEETGSAVEGLRLGAGEVAAFVGSERIRGLRDDGLDDARETRDGADVPADPEIRTFRRFMQGAVVYGRLPGGGRAAEEVASSDLADARVRPRLVIRPRGP